MRIAFVMDDMSVHSNGTSSTALRYADALREQGHEVICVAFGADGPDSFDVPEHHIPVVTPVAEGLDFHFAQPDEAVFDEAFADVDVIHIFLPFALGQAARDWGRAHGVPVTAAFHLQPENVTYNANLGGSALGLRCHLQAVSRLALRRHPPYPLSEPDDRQPAAQAWLPESTPCHIQWRAQGVLPRRGRELQ